MLPNSPSMSGPRTLRDGPEATMTRHPFVGLAAAGVMSVMAHGFAYASLGFAPRPPREPPPSRVSFRVHDASPASPAPPPPVAPPREPPPREQAKSKAVPRVNPEPVAPPPAAVDLRGVTLTNDMG